MRPCGHEDLKVGCHLCGLYEHDPRYRALWDSDRWKVKASKSPPPSQPRKKQKIALDCIHLDPEVFSSGGKSYRECLKGHGDICGCDKPQKCGPKCLDYQAQ